MYAIARMCPPILLPPLSRNQCDFSLEISNPSFLGSACQACFLNLTHFLVLSVISVIRYDVLIQDLCPAKTWVKYM